LSSNTFNIGFADDIVNPALSSLESNPSCEVYIATF
jgi:hypothetical protein